MATELPFSEDSSAQALWTEVQSLRRKLGEVSTLAYELQEQLDVRDMSRGPGVAPESPSAEAFRDQGTRLRLALQAASMGTFIWNVEEECGEPDEQMLALLGLPMDTPLSLKSALEAGIHPDDRERYAESLRRATDPSGDGVIQEDIRVLHPDGSLHWLSITGQVYFAGSPRLADRMAGAAIDITTRKETEAALREKEEWLRMVQAAGGVGGFDYDLQKDEAICSPEYYTLFGLNEQTVLTRKTWGASIHPEDRQKAFEALDAAIRDHRPFEHEYRIVRADTGEERWVAGRAAIILDASGQPWRYVGGSIDITELRKVEQTVRVNEDRHAFLLRLADELRALEDPFEIQTIACAMVGQKLGVSQVVYVDIDGDDYVARAGDATEVSLFQERGRVSEFGGFLAEFYKRGSVVMSSDVAADPRLEEAEKETFGRQCVAAFAAAALFKGGNMVGAIRVHDTRPRLWTTGEQELLQEVVERIWAAALRASAEANLRESERQLRRREAELAHVQRVGGVGGVEVDVVAGLTGRRSPEYLRLHGLSRDAVNESHEDWLRRVHPEDRESADRVLRSALESGAATYESEYRIIRPNDGEERWIFAKADIERDGNGKPLRLIGAHIDITERKQAEEVLRENERRQTFLLAVGDALRPLRDPIEIQRTASSLLGDHLGAYRVGYAEARAGGEILEVSRHFCRGAASVEGPHRISDFGADLHGFLKGRTMVRPDVASDSQLTPRQKAVYADLEIGATLNKPLLKEDELLAVFFVHFREPHRFTEEEISLIEEMGERTWTSVERARAAEALRISEENYRTLFESIDEGFCLIQMMFDENGRAFDYRFLEANPAFEKHTGLCHAVGNTMLELAPSIEPFWVETYERVARERKPQRFEQMALALGRFFDVFAFPVGEPEKQKVALLFNDITERKNAEAALAADLRNMQLLLDLGSRFATEAGMRPLYAEINAISMKLVQADGGTVQIYDQRKEGLSIIAASGFSVDEVERFDWVDATSSTSCGAALRSGKRCFVDYDDPSLPDPDGELAAHLAAGYRSAQSTPLIARSGKPIGMISTHWRHHHRPSVRELGYLDLLARQTADLLEQREADRKISESEERLRTLFESMNEAFVIKEAIEDAEGRVVDYRFIECNPAFSRQTGLKDVKGHTVLELMPKVERLWLENYEKVLRTGEATQFEAYIAPLDRWLAVSAARLGGPDSKRVAIVFMDISERKRSEAALQRAREELEARVAERTHDLEKALERLRAEIVEKEKLEEARHDLLRRLVTTQEEERKRISRDLHDNLGQYLTSVMLQLHAIQKEFERKPEGVNPGKSFEELKAIVKSLMDAAHRQAWELRPTELDHFGLEAALRSYLNVWSGRTGIEVDFQSIGWNDQRIDPDCEIALYRVAQEALTNVARHAGATKVTVRLETDGNTELDVVDNGRGFDPVLANDRLGLLGMSERVALVNGTLEIFSTPGGGTRVHVKVTHC
ncbi:PAS domain-containing protein [Luteolibacter ambystomatis]|uniref:histidine kinase n=1 Tax=Luteolibacter ambystomatis TaxID=2824561 RepID=A0A975J3C4_9BACT|nr:PAS domain-containing protein [Luteolibacter ambystomatis]QUE53236.1 PAS domain-containing protein [Luteolibacter ambystomatis]